MFRLPSLRISWPTAALCGVVLATALASPATAASDRAAFDRWTTNVELAQGTVSNARVASNNVYMRGGTKSSWTSPWATTPFGAARSVIPSWSIVTPARSWAVVQVRVRSGRTVGSWDTVANWATGTSAIKRSSGSTQSDDLARVNTDTVTANTGKAFDAWQVRVTLRRTSTSGQAPVLRAVNGVTASYVTRSMGTTTTTMNRTVDLDVPTSSQMLHTGHFRQWGGGGEAWCSPTSTSMVLRYFGTGPSARSYAFARESRGYVDHAARYTFDHAYDGAGNWSFNTAYATVYPVDAFVTRLYHLREAESFIKAGIPLVVGIAFGRGGLSGAPISSSPGHLLVIRGFTTDGSVIVNDPAGSFDGSVKRTYSRSQFERAWLTGSGGIAYVIRPGSTPLPADTPRW